MNLDFGSKIWAGDVSSVVFGMRVTLEGMALDITAGSTPCLFWVLHQDLAYSSAEANLW